MEVGAEVDCIGSAMAQVWRVRPCTLAIMTKETNYTVPYPEHMPAVAHISLDPTYMRPFCWPTLPHLVPKPPLLSRYYDQL